ncbi:hypothetical protein JAAARDRAFT_42196 [Jaapia argillacea MUCL 33604]|uniref:Uncharacterized protein n=1 Tax=Jaapia argillacea MUCL 33604 TaxID=933084 RepID=A0A067PIK8_9AGAM|nr:hypothetical protein JAAARDRAFT_42196 [Jaapia argillacea MUCL 33604]
MASNTVTTTPTSIQISGITILMDPVVDHKLSIELLVDGGVFIKQQFGRNIPGLRCDLSPPMTLMGGSRLVVQLREHRTIQSTNILAEAVFVNQNLQQSMLGASGAF